MRWRVFLGGVRRASLREGAPGLCRGQLVREMGRTCRAPGKTAFEFLSGDVHERPKSASGGF